MWLGLGGGREYEKRYMRIYLFCGTSVPGGRGKQATEEGGGRGAAGGLRGWITLFLDGICFLGGGGETRKRSVLRLVPFFLLPFLPSLSPLKIAKESIITLGFAIFECSLID